MSQQYIWFQSSPRGNGWLFYLFLFVGGAGGMCVLFAVVVWRRLCWKLRVTGNRNLVWIHSHAYTLYTGDSHTLTFASISECHLTYHFEWWTIFFRVCAPHTFFCFTSGYEHFNVREMKVDFPIDEQLTKIQNGFPLFFFFFLLLVRESVVHKIGNRSFEPSENSNNNHRHSGISIHLFSK